MKKSPYIKFTHSQRDLLEKGDKLGKDELKEKAQIHRELLELFKKDSSFMIVDEPRDTKHTILFQQYQKAYQTRKILKEQGIIRELSKLDDVRRKEELIDTSLVGYLQLKFVEDPVDYIAWTKDDNQPGIPSKTATHNDFVQQQNAIIDAMPKSLRYCSNDEVKNLFSTFTSHVRHEKDAKGNPNNIIRYRNEAVQYIPELFDALKKAKPVKLSPNEVSYKMLLVPTPGGGGSSVIEFKYRDTFTARGKHDKNIGIRVFSDWGDAKKQLQSDISAMYTKKNILEDIYHDAQRQYEMNKDNTNKQYWVTFIQKIEHALDNVYDGVYIQQAEHRIENIKVKHDKLYANHYSMSVGGMLRDIKSALKTLTIMIKRLEKYVYAPGKIVLQEKT